MLGQSTPESEITPAGGTRCLQSRPPSAVVKDLGPGGVTVGVCSDGDAVVGLRARERGPVGANSLEACHPRTVQPTCNHGSSLVLVGAHGYTATGGGAGHRVEGPRRERRPGYVPVLAAVVTLQNGGRLRSRTALTAHDDASSFAGAAHRLEASAYVAGRVTARWDGPRPSAVRGHDDDAVTRRVFYPDTDASQETEAVEIGETRIAASAFRLGLRRPTPTTVGGSQEIPAIRRGPSSAEHRDTTKARQTHS